MGKWTRRAVITTGVVAGGGFVVGVALRPGHRAPGMAHLVTGEGESLVNAWVKIGSDNHITAIVPHSEMGQGAQTALSQMLADELDAHWQDVSFIEAPAEDEYANWALGKGFILGDAEIPQALVPTVDGLFLQVGKAMHLQITGGSANSATWVQIFSDVIGKPIDIPGAVDLPPLGIAIAAAYGVGAIKTFEEGIEKIAVRDSFKPDAENHEYYTEMYGVFRNLYENIKGEYDALAGIQQKFGKKSK